MSTLRKLFRSAFVVCALWLQSGLAAAEPENGWWWNPDESGRGFYLEARDGVMFLAGYLYDTDGRATWISSGGPITDPYLYEGRLQAFRNGQPTFGAYRPPDPAVDLGPITIKFDDDEHATMTWPGGSVALERVSFGESLRVSPNVNGWWWNPDESGSGYSVEIQGESLFVAAFMYDDSGNPVWYLTAGPMTTPTHYDGEWLEFRGGQTLTGAYRPPGSPTVFAHATIDFASSNEGTITFAEGASARKRAMKNRNRSSPMRRLYPLRAYYWDDQWPHWDGTLTLSLDREDEGTTLQESYTWSLHWSRDPRRKEGQETTFYSLLPISSLTYTFRFHDKETGCFKTRDWTRTAAERPDLINGTLIIYSDLTYEGWVGSHSLLSVEEINCEGNSSELVEILNYLEFPGRSSYSLPLVQNFYSAPYYALGRIKPNMNVYKHWFPGSYYWLEWHLDAYP